MAISSGFPYNRSLKSYQQFTFNSTYVANVILRKKLIRVMLNDEYLRLRGLKGIVDAPDAHYGHTNCYFDLDSSAAIPTVVSYITKC